MKKIPGKQYICEYGIRGAVAGANTVDDLDRYLATDPHPQYRLVSCQWMTGYYGANWHLVWELSRPPAEAQDKEGAE